MNQEIKLQALNKSKTLSAAKQVEAESEPHVVGSNSREFKWTNVSFPDLRPPTPTAIVKTT